jgi:hypothetical protein
MIPGDYEAVITVASNDPDEPAVDIPVHLHVVGVPRIDVSPPQLSYGTVYVGQSRSLPITVTSVGTDSLLVTGLTFGDPAFTADATSFVLDPGASRVVNITYAPQSAVSVFAALSVASNDPATPVTSIALQGAGAIPPDIELSPLSFDESVAAGQSIARTLTIANQGGTVLEWRVGTSAHGLQGPAIESDSLEEVLASLDDRYASVTAAIPNRFDFNEGEAGYSIQDGGNDMYDDGNYLLTDIAQGVIPYSDGIISTDSAFGGRYFTRKYPGLFVLVADLQGPDAFFILGTLGADGAGAADSTILHVPHGVDYLGFVKRVHGAGDPSVNHLVIVEDRPGLYQEISYDTRSDFQAIRGLGGASTRIYYLLYAGNGGSYIDDAAASEIMAAFLDLLTPPWLSASPGAGTVAPGSSVPITLTLDAGALPVGTQQGAIVVTSNDPDEPSTTVPVTLHVGATVTAPARSSPERKP